MAHKEKISVAETQRKALVWEWLLLKRARKLITWLWRKGKVVTTANRDRKKVSRESTYALQDEPMRWWAELVRHNGKWGTEPIPRDSKLCNWHMEARIGRVAACGTLAQLGFLILLGVAPADSKIRCS